MQMQLKLLWHNLCRSLSAQVHRFDNEACKCVVYTVSLELSLVEASVPTTAGLPQQADPVLISKQYGGATGATESLGGN